MNTPMPSSYPRTTNVPGLDAILGGGIPPHNLSFIIGAAGAGKTVLSMQIAMGYARQGIPVLFLTAFSESHDRLLEHMRPFSFFDPMLVGQQITLLSIFSMLQQDVDKAASEVLRTIRQLRAGLVVIDGMAGVRHLFTTEVQLRRFLQTLAAQLVYVDTTLLITYEMSASSFDDQSAEMTMADAIIALHFRTRGLQHERWLEARKIRGQAHQNGLHRYQINGDGVVVYPRLETQHFDVSADLPEERVTFGVPALDALCGGGMPRTNSTLLVGSIGTGKTLLALQFLLSGVLQGEQGIFVTFNETLPQLATVSRRFRLPLADAIATGQIHIVRRPSTELDPDELANTLEMLLGKYPIQRLAIDGMGLFQHALERQGRAQDYLVALVELLRARRVTSVLTVEINRLLGREVDFSGTPLAILGENVVLLQQTENNMRWSRTLAVLRMRSSDHSHDVHEFIITEQGLTVTSLAALHPPAKTSKRQQSA